MLDRTVAPSFQRSTQLSLLTPQQYSLTNGSVLHILSGGTQEVVQIDLIAPAGKWYEPTVGVSHFTALLLDKGTASRSSFQIASFFDSLGAHIEITPGNDFITINIYSLSKHIEEVLKMVIHLLTESVFPEQELSLSKSIITQNLKVNEEKTSFVAGRLFRKTLFGDHPYGSELNEESILAITRNNLSSYHQSRLVNFTAIASGNISESLTKKLINVLNQLPAKNTDQIVRSFTTPPPAPLHQTKEGSVQTTIRFGKRIVNRQHPDFFDVTFLTHLLGGYFGSRLMKNIREEKGLTYGIYASVNPLLRDSFFVIGADVNRENRELTIQEIRSEIKQLIDNPVPAEELTTAKNHFIGSLQAEVTTIFAQGEKFKTVLLNSLPATYYQDMVNRVETITAYDLQRTAALHFAANSFTEVSVG